MQTRLYFYSGQAATVRALLNEAGLGTATGGMMGVNEAKHLQGCHGTFAYVLNHPIPVPHDMMQVVTANGMYVISLSDQFRRGKIYQKQMA